MFIRVPSLKKIKKQQSGPTATEAYAEKPSPETLPQSNKSLDQKLVSALSGKQIPSLKQLKYLPQVLTPKQNRLLVGLIALIGISLVALGINFYQRNFIVVPAFGGEHTSGLVGAPQYINPLLSQNNDVDADLARLIFSGLLKYDKDLQLVPDLADHWTVSDDQKTYTFVLKDGVSWQDGAPLTADDVVFTFQSIADPDFKSPLIISFRGISVEKIDNQTVRFVLPQPYPSFLELLTVGILPEHIWSGIPAINANLTEYNIKPIGSGPWQFKTLVKDQLGNIKSYTLEANPNFYGQKPYLENLTFKFYPDFETAVAALKSHSVEGISLLPKEFKADLSGQKNLRYYSFTLPQYTAIFFNQKKNAALKDKNIRKALAAAIDKTKILNDVLQGEGEAIDGPILPVDITASSSPQFSANSNTANTLLDNAGWQRLTAQEYQAFLASQAQKQADAEAKAKTAAEKNTSNAKATTVAADTTSPKPLAATGISTSTPSETAAETPTTTQTFYRKNGDTILEITLTTVNQPEDMQAAEIIQTAWENIGVKVNLNIVEGNRMARDIIKPRNYELLLFGIIVGADADPFPFWHSSQAADPGLNLALYSNREADKLLEDGRAATDSAKLQDIYTRFQALLASDLPAIFLYKPTYTYVADKKIKGINIDRIITPADRFNNVEDWYIKTKRQWRGGLN